MTYNATAQTIFYKQLGNNSLGRDIIIGDLHGNIAALYNILDEINFDESKDRIISTGDVVDRGPNSLDTLRLTKKSYFQPTRGNHEEFIHAFCLALKEFMKTTNNYESENALRFISSNGKALLSMSSEWLYDLAKVGSLNIDLIEEIIALTAKKDIPHILTISDEKRELIFTHASLPSSLPRNLNSSRGLIEKHLLRGQKADNALNEILWSVTSKFVSENTKTILLKDTLTNLDNDNCPLTFHGHTVFNEVFMVEQEIFMDTGCGFTYNPRFKNNPRLSALVWQEKRLIEANDKQIINQSF